MAKETVISIMGNKFSYSKNDDGSEKLEWRKIRNTRVSNNGAIKSRPTLFGEKAKISGNSTVENGYTISFCVYIRDNIVTSFTTSTENN
ncbi:MAG: hypothetical protein IJ817_03370 [Clostridia bacterium]|nr:hypothetical protein [Clostridia bacterium]